MRRRLINEYDSDDNEGGAALYDTADGIDESQFATTRPQLPIKTVIFIVVFLIAGMVCVTISTLILSGYIEEKYSDRIWPLFMLGGIFLIPGGYYGYILFCIIFGISNYTADDIPIL